MKKRIMGTLQLKTGMKVKLKPLNKAKKEGVAGIVPPMKPFFGNIVTIEKWRDREYFHIKEIETYIWHLNWIESCITLPEHLFEIE